MKKLRQVETGRLDLGRFEGVISDVQYRQLLRAVAQAQRQLSSVTIWNVNSTAQGGGVAEMLRSLLAYIKGADLDARWLTITGSPEFFLITKRIHNLLHGSPGDGGPLDQAARETYGLTLAACADELAAMVRPGDVVLLHDPQTAGMAPAVREVGAHVVWRCHVGVDVSDGLTRSAQRFLFKYLPPAEAYVFSRDRFVWEDLERSKVRIIPPSIDAFSTKNRDMDAGQVRDVLRASGLVDDGPPAAACFTRLDGSEGRVAHVARMPGDTRPREEDRLVVQVSRWDRLKDPVGVMRGFVDHVAPYTDAHLVLAGPEVSHVADDPEGQQVLDECVAAWRGLPTAVASRVHLASLPMVDSEENGAMVNALQHRADVVVQKSLAEGFGLTVTEAMWKGRPLVASRVGGIQDQVEDGRTGVLVQDPRNLAEFGSAVCDLLEDPERAKRLGAAARQAVRDHFLGPRHLIQYAELVGSLVSADD
jgi:trehalose synthase